MRSKNLSIAAGLALVGAVLATGAGQAAPVPARSGTSAPALPLTLAGEKEKAAVEGALVGGALGVILGTTLGQSGAYPPPPPVHYAPPPPAYAPPPPVVEDEPPARRVVIERRPSRRVVEVEEEEAAPEVVEEEECVTRQTKVYDPNSGRTIVRKERDCD
jgi:hypothetical protein